MYCALCELNGKDGHFGQCYGNTWDGLITSTDSWNVLFYFIGYCITIDNEVYLFLYVESVTSVKEI